MLCKLLAIPVILTLAGVAHSADMAGRFISPPALPSQPKWSGVYGGLTGGYGRNAQTLETLYFPLGGAVVAVTLGYNRRLGSAVVGLETDVSWSGIQRKAVVGGLTDIVSRKIQAFGTLRGRVGYALGSFLPYLTGGLYWQQSKVEASLPSAPGYAGEVAVLDNSLGWTLGGGMEIALPEGWSVKGEYLYAKAKADYSVPLPFGTITRQRVVT